MKRWEMWSKRSGFSWRCNRRAGYKEREQDVREMVRLLEREERSEYL